MYANSIVRNAGSTWAIASVDEWYKAAYYKGGGLNSGYWVYGTSSDVVTTAMANYGDSSGVLAVGLYPFASAYGAFDMAGNLFEWNDSIVTRVVSGDGRGVRGGSFNHSESFMSRFYSIASFPTNDSSGATGFRVSMIPGPSSLVLVCTALLGARGRRRVVGLSDSGSKRIAA
jgi:formylglycine-generating enzyme required for sulfatase activity